MKDRLPKPPTTKELIEPIRKLLDYLDASDLQDGDGWSVARPQVEALRAAFVSHRAGRDVAYLIWNAQEEKMYGPQPRSGGVKHPNCDYWDDVLNEIDELALQRTTKDEAIAEAEYASLRRQMLADREIARHLPPSLKSATTLADLHKQLNEASKDADNPQEAQHEFLANDLRPFRWWINGQSPFGSPEWLALETWFVNTALSLIHATMCRVDQIREVVEGSGVREVRSTRWRRFVLKHFGGGAIIRALEVGWASMMAEQEALAIDRADPYIRRMNDISLQIKQESDGES
jgi:hypothetical protein